jgi:hypothetical protein
MMGWMLARRVALLSRDTLAICSAGMLMPKIVFLFCAVLLSACAVTPRGPDSYYFDCDTPAGDFSEWNRTIAGAALSDR